MATATRSQRQRPIPARTPGEIEAYLETRLANARDHVERARIEAAIRRCQSREAQGRVTARILLAVSLALTFAITAQIFSVASELHDWTPRF